MSQFEQELIRAIEHGCPSKNCPSSDIFAVGFNQSYMRLVTHDEEELVYGAREDKWEQEPRFVTCSLCYTDLWNPSSGWIPELQEIVKEE